MPPLPDGRLLFPSAERNGPHILAVLREYVGTLKGALPSTTAPPAAETVLEVASGSGQHVALFAAAMPSFAFQPTNYEEEKYAESLRAWTAAAAASASASAAESGGRVPRIKDAVFLDAAEVPWRHFPDGGGFAAIYNVNMAHISPWATTVGLMANAGRLLAPDAPLLMYGPFKVDGACTTESNADFDASLRSKDASWGIRDVADVEAEAKRNGLRLVERREMPANNFCLVFRRGLIAE